MAYGMLDRPILRGWGVFHMSFSHLEQWNIEGGLVDCFRYMLITPAMILAADPRRCARPNKIGGVYARVVAGRVLVGWRAGVGRKNSGAAVGLDVAIGEDRSTGLVGSDDGFLPFLGCARRVVAWVASHGMAQSLGNAPFSRCRLIITSLHHGAAIGLTLADRAARAVANRAGLPPRTRPFVLIHPRRAGRSQPQGNVSVERADPSPSHLKDGPSQIAKHGRVQMGSGVRDIPRAAISPAASAKGGSGATGQGARCVLAQGGMRFATLGGGAGHVNGA